MESPTSPPLPPSVTSGEQWHEETSWLEVMRDTATSLRRASTRQLMLRPPPPESPQASRKNLHESVDMGDLDELVATLPAAADGPAVPAAPAPVEQAPAPPPRERWVGGKGAELATDIRCALASPLVAHCLTPSL